jgi:hypothetical protein
MAEHTIDETDLQRHIAGQFQDFWHQSPSNMSLSDVGRRFMNCLPDIRRTLSDKCDAIKTQSGRSIDPSDISLEIRALSDSSVFIRMALDGESQTWLEQLD